VKLLGVLNVIERGQFIIVSTISFIGDNKAKETLPKSRISIIPILDNTKDFFKERDSYSRNMENVYARSKTSIKG
jgi:hypothetical protein